MIRTAFLQVTDRLEREGQHKLAESFTQVVAKFISERTAQSAKALAEVYASVEAHVGADSEDVGELRQLVAQKSPEFQKAQQAYLNFYQ